uniref:Zinc finger PHD-type domain-containing protein n=1 Tax=Noccaea caerulescens TaxID=107243 RepID=A0A1J3DH39_NOCCA
MESPPPTHRSSTVDKNPSKLDILYDRFVTENPDLDCWIWIIEYFAKFKTQLWMIHDVFEMNPKLPDYLGEHANEMVAFRCLASLFDSSTCAQSKDVDSIIEFDSSESCEYVLQCILDEIPLSELKPGAPGLSKWNLVPFIESKLLRLPKCALELLIETSCEKETGVSPCKGQETDQVTSRIEEGQSFGHGPGDGDDEISSERRDESDGHVSSPSEKRYRCSQCKESGKLLFCSSDGCEVMVHEKCVVESPPVYDDDGNFYCSLCGLDCDSAEYLQSQDEVAKAKKKLVSFLSVMSEVSKKKKAIEGY